MASFPNKIAQGSTDEKNDCEGQARRWRWRPVMVSSSARGPFSFFVVLKGRLVLVARLVSTILGSGLPGCLSLTDSD